MRKLCRSVVSLSCGVLALSQTALGFFVDGDGHYSLLGETRMAPGFAKDSGTYQAIRQDFRLEGEARLGDMSSVFLEFRLFEDRRRSYLGDTGEPAECEVTGEDGDDSRVTSDCTGRHQDTGEPGYEPYTPRITKAYVRYAFDYCILEAGRRGRDWGMGIFLDDGNDPLDTSSSVFDGVTCHVNIQKTQTLGFSIGYDKLSETGTFARPEEDPKREEDRGFGPSDAGDDINQYFFTIEYDDRKANAGADLTKEVGVYFAQVSSPGLDKGGSATDLKFLDLYTGLYFSNLTIRNEVLFRMGKSADPNWRELGGKELHKGNVAKNELESIGVAGGLAWTFARSGSAIGPAEFNKGNASRHLTFLDYAYAPGDPDGYYLEDIPGNQPASRNDKDIDEKVKAMAFHRNFTPALILFNAPPTADDLRVDGVFNPSRFMNATLLATGYRYESLENGNFELKLIGAQLNQAIPGGIKDYYEDQNIAERPIGYYGKSLGYELDLAYEYNFGRDVTLGAAAAAAMPGDAWKTSDDEEPANNFLLRTHATFRF